MDYDSEADALDIELFPFERFEGQEPVHDTFCQVGFAKGEPASIELLGPAEQIPLLDVAAERYHLDAAALKAAACAALAAPDRVIKIDVGSPLSAAAA
ncbi:MAG TPA: hypothetical protein VF245_04635 [Solirubrobacterales bacterium]